MKSQFLLRSPAFKASPSSRSTTPRQRASRRDRGVHGARSARGQPGGVDQAGGRLEERAQESPTQSPARPRSAKAQAVRKSELQCLEMVLRRSCPRDAQVAGYLRRAHNVEPTGQERIFCFEGPDEHIRRALLLQEPPWVENESVTSQIFHLKWTVSDSEADYCELREGALFNHFQKNRELTTKVGLANNLRRFACEEQVDIDRFFPRCYDMSSASDVQDFVLDFRRGAALNVLRQHLRLSAWAAERQRLMEVAKMDWAGSSYMCNVNVLRIAVKALVHWLEDLDGSFLEEEGRGSERRKLYSEEWDALVLYSELSDAQLCGDDAEAERKRVLRGYSASGAWQPGTGREGVRVENHQKWPEFRDHYWGEAPEHLRQQAQVALEQLEARWPQFSAQGPMNVWVAKPGSCSKGKGVICMDSLPEVLHHCKTAANRIVQKYIERPLLLFSGRKFDLRQWVLVRSFQPLKVHMFSSCYLRLCNEPYDLGDLANRQRHISNWSVNKCGKHVSDGAVASLQEFQEVLEMITGKSNYWETELIPQLKSCILQTLQAVQSNMVQRPESFEVYGFDFLIGEDLKPWLLEVNLSPACESRTQWMSDMLERMASRLVELLLQGHLLADGKEPDWVCICDETANVKGEDPMSCWLENKEDLSETWGHKDLTVVGKALSKRAARRLDQIWRRNEAQIALARTFRGCRVRWRLRAARQRACAHLVEHARARAWATLLRRCAVERQRPPAARLVVSLVRRFAAQRRVWAARRRKEAIGIQRLWRGWLGRRRASLARQDRAATRLQRWWRSSKLLRMLRAKRRVLCWWRHVQARRSRAARSIQAATRGFLGTRRYSFLLLHLVQPIHRLTYLLSCARWRWAAAALSGASAVVALQRCWRGRRGRARARARRALREAFGRWRSRGRAYQASAVVLQRLYRGARGRRVARRRQRALHALQRAWRAQLRTKRRVRVRAAVALQRSFRGFQCRNGFRFACHSALCIQRAFKGFLARRRLQMLRRFATLKQRWLREIPQAEDWNKHAEGAVEDATTRSSTFTPGSREDSETGSATATGSGTADEREISIGLVEEPRLLVSDPSAGPPCEPPWAIRQGRRDYHFEDRPDQATALPLLTHLQHLARSFDAILASSSARRAEEEDEDPPSDDAAPSTGSALRAARQLRVTQGYTKPTVSSTRRTTKSPKVKGPRRAKQEADLNALLMRTYVPQLVGPRRRESQPSPWRLSNIEPEPWLL